MLEADWPQIVIVLGVILAIIAVHSAYYGIAESYNSQMQLSAGQIGGFNRVVLTDGFDTGDQVRHYDLARIDVRKLRPNPTGRPNGVRTAIRQGSGQPARSRTGLRKMADGAKLTAAGLATREPSVFGPARVFDSDVCLESDVTFFVPVKVTGDLEINGNAEFNETVIVDGMMIVRGRATFLGGVLVKGDVTVDGLAILDAAIQESWLVGRKLKGRGIIAQSKMSPQQNLVKLAS